MLHGLASLPPLRISPGFTEPMPIRAVARHNLQARIVNSPYVERQSPDGTLTIPTPFPE